MIFESKYPPRNHPDVTIYQLLFEGNERIVDEKPCYVDAEDHSEVITFAQLKSLILKFGAGLKRNIPGFTQGDIVAIYSPNNIYYLPVLHGIVAVGGAAATIDHTVDVETVVAHLKTVGAKVLIAHPETLDRAIKAAEIAGIPAENVFTLDKNDIVGTRCVESAFWSHEELAVPVTYTKEELATTPCYYYFTSGTTGKKKAVVLTQKSIVATISLKDAFLPKEFVLLAQTELHHSSSLLGTIHMNPMYGCTTYVLKEYTFERFLLAIQNCKINLIITQPWITASMAKEPIVDKYDISSLRFMLTGGSVVNKNMCMTFYKRFGVPAINGFGITEILNTFDASFEWTLAGVIGPLGPGFSCKLIDEEGNELGYNQPGELCVKGPTLTPGYHNNPEANAAAFDKDGFYHTGDLFKVNEEGLFSYLDRIKDVIKYKYHHINPQDIETVLMSHPLVSDSAAIGVYAEEESAWLPTAFVTLTDHNEGDEIIKKEILQIAETQLPDEMQLRGGLYIIDDFPRTSTGKILRRALHKHNVLVDK